MDHSITLFISLADLWLAEQRTAKSEDAKVIERAASGEITRETAIEEMYRDADRRLKLEESLRERGNDLAKRLANGGNESLAKHVLRAIEHVKDYDGSTDFDWAALRAELRYLTIDGNNKQTISLTKTTYDPDPDTIKAIKLISKALKAGNYKRSEIATATGKGVGEISTIKNRLVGGKYVTKAGKKFT